MSKLIISADNQIINIDDLVYVETPTLYHSFKVKRIYADGSYSKVYDAFGNPFYCNRCFKNRHTIIKYLIDKYQSATQSYFLSIENLIKATDLLVMELTKLSEANPVNTEELQIVQS